MNTFWQYGYHATSIQQLVTATGLKPGSLYMAFDNKAGLFKASLEHYINNGIEEIHTKAAERKCVKTVIIDILRQHIDDTEAPDYRGCFAFNSQLELSPVWDKDLHDFTSLQLAKVEKTFLHHLSEVYPDDTAKEYAGNIMIHIAGLQAYGRYGRERNHLEKLLKTGLPWLPWQAN